jgi:hypothetical protein
MQNSERFVKFSEITEDTLFTIEADPDILYLKVKKQKKTCCKSGYNCIYYTSDDKKANATMDDTMEVFVIGQLTEEDVELFVEPEEEKGDAEKKEAIINEREISPNPASKKFGGGGMGQKYPKQRNPRNKNDF